MDDRGIGIAGHFEVADQERPARGMWHHRTGRPDQGEQVALRNLHRGTTHSWTRNSQPGLDRLRNWHRRKARSGATRGIVIRGWTVCGIGIAGGPGPVLLVE